MLTLDSLSQLVDGGDIDTVIVGFSDHYGRLCGKRYDAELFLEEIATGGTHACDYLLTTDMEMEPVPGYRFANWQLGYGDLHLVPDLSTLRLASWLDRTALVLCDVEGAGVAPRTILRRQCERAAGLGLSAMAATELEYYVFTTGYRDAAAAGYATSALEPA